MPENKAGEESTRPDVPACQMTASLPFVKRRQYMYPSSEPTYTVLLLAVVGEENTAAPVRSEEMEPPDPESRAYTYPASQPTYTTLPPMLRAGEERIKPAVVLLHNTAPVPPFHAYTLPSSLPQYTVPPASTAGEDSNRLPAL